MTKEYFDQLFDKYLVKGHYGLEFDKYNVIKYLIPEFKKEIEINPDFEFYQIKYKFGQIRVYTNSPNNSMWERSIDNLERKLLLSRIQTPDGTVLISNSRHDYVTHIDENGETYMLDGGTDYQRTSLTLEPFDDLSIWDDFSFKTIRLHYARGGRGKNGDEPLKWVPISKMSDEWLRNCISYNYGYGMDDSPAKKIYADELEYRLFKGIIIED